MEHLTSAEVLKLRDKLFFDYYSDERIQNNLRTKFGQKTIDHINQMLSVKLNRKILAQ